MRSYFIGLFDYDHVANRILFGLVKEASNPGAADHTAAARTLSVMSHLMASHRSWLLRCQGESSAAIELWPVNNTLEEVGVEIEELNRDWKTFLENEPDFERSFTYINQTGKTYTNVLSDVLAHIINHGTHHRAQIGQQLKAAGLQQLPPTDYIAYLRMKNM